MFSAGAMLAYAIISAVIMVVSMVMSIQQQRAAARKQKKAQEEAEKAEDRRKGVEVVTEAESVDLPIVYGRAKVGGARVYHTVQNSFKMPSSINSNKVLGTGINAGTYKISTISYSKGAGATIQKVNTNVVCNNNSKIYLNRSWSGEKNEYLFWQQAICQAPIYRVRDILVEDSSTLDNPTYGSYQISKKLKKTKGYYKYWYSNQPGNALRFDIHNYGGIVDSVAKYNCSDRSTAYFTDTAYATCVAKQDRENPAFSAVPKIQFIIEGRQIRDITRTQLFTGKYSYGVSEDYTYSTNPSRVLLDYLLSDDYGAGLSLSQIDLESFYNAKEICDEIVLPSAKVGGLVWQPTDHDDEITNRALPRFECCAVINGSSPIRENVNQILESMTGSKLVWSQGKFKLKLNYPTEETLNNDDIPVITDDDLVSADKIDVTGTTGDNRYNYCKVTFSDESQNFNQNSVSWPPRQSYSNRESEKDIINTWTDSTPIGGIAYSQVTGWETDKSYGTFLNSFAIADNDDGNSSDMLFSFVAEESGSYTFEYSGDDYASLSVYRLDTVGGLDNQVLLHTGGNRNKDGIASFTLYLVKDHVYQVLLHIAFTQLGDKWTDNPPLYGGGFRVQAPSGVQVLSSRDAAYTNYIVNTYTDEVYKTYLKEDSFVDLETEITSGVITDYYHALALAEQTVRRSRAAMIVSFTIVLKDYWFEPGDIVRLKSEYLNLGIDKPLFLEIDSVEVTTDEKCNISATRIDPKMYAWNVEDTALGRVETMYSTVHSAPAWVQYTANAGSTKGSAGVITFAPVSGNQVVSYRVYLCANGALNANGTYNWTELGSTLASPYTLPAIDVSSAIFGVRAEYNDGVLSDVCISGTGEPIQLTWFPELFANRIGGVYSVITTGSQIEYLYDYFDLSNISTPNASTVESSKTWKEFLTANDNTTFVDEVELAYTESGTYDIQTISGTATSAIDSYTIEDREIPSKDAYDCIGINETIVLDLKSINVASDLEGIDTVAEPAKVISKDSTGAFNSSENYNESVTIKFYDGGKDIVSLPYTVYSIRSSDVFNEATSYSEEIEIKLYEAQKTEAQATNIFRPYEYTIKICPPGLTAYTEGVELETIITTYTTYLYYNNSSTNPTFFVRCNFANTKKELLTDESTKVVYSDYLPVNTEYYTISWTEVETFYDYYNNVKQSEYIRWLTTDQSTDRPAVATEGTGLSTSAYRLYKKKDGVIYTVVAEVASNYYTFTGDEAYDPDAEYFAVAFNKALYRGTFYDPMTWTATLIDGSIAIEAELFIDQTWLVDAKISAEDGKYMFLADDADYAKVTLNAITTNYVNPVYVWYEAGSTEVLCEDESFVITRIDLSGLASKTYMLYVYEETLGNQASYDEFTVYNLTNVDSPFLITTAPAAFVVPCDYRGYPKNDVNEWTFIISCLYDRNYTDTSTSKISLQPLESSELDDKASDGSYKISLNVTSVGCSAFLSRTAMGTLILSVSNINLKTTYATATIYGTYKVSDTETLSYSKLVSITKELDGAPNRLPNTYYIETTDGEPSSADEPFIVLRLWYANMGAAYNPIEGDSLIITYNVTKNSDPNSIVSNGVSSVASSATIEAIYDEEGNLVQEAREADKGTTEAAYRFDGEQWVRFNNYIDGNFMVTGSIAASALNVKQLSAISADLGTITVGQLVGEQCTFSGKLIAATGEFAGSLRAGVLDFTKLAGTSVAADGANAADGGIAKSEILLCNLPDNCRKLKVFLQGAGGAGYCAYKGFPYKSTDGTYYATGSGGSSGSSYAGTIDLTGLKITSVAAYTEGSTITQINSQATLDKIYGSTERSGTPLQVSRINALYQTSQNTTSSPPNNTLFIVKVYSNRNYHNIYQFVNGTWKFLMGGTKNNTVLDPSKDSDKYAKIVVEAGAGGKPRIIYSNGTFKHNSNCALLTDGSKVGGASRVYMNINQPDGSPYLYVNAPCGANATGATSSTWDRYNCISTAPGKQPAAGNTVCNIGAWTINNEQTVRGSAGTAGSSGWIARTKSWYSSLNVQGPWAGGKGADSYWGKGGSGGTWTSYTRYYSYETCDSACTHND